LVGCPFPKTERLTCCVREASKDVDVRVALFVLPLASKVLSVLAWALTEESFAFSDLEPNKDKFSKNSYASSRLKA
jgi:hypothetical protein